MKLSEAQKIRLQAYVKIRRGNFMFRQYHNLLDDALQRLSARDRATIREHILPTSSDIGLAVEQTLAAAQEKQRCCLEKRWRFRFAGREFILKEEADRVIH